MVKTIKMKIVVVLSYEKHTTGTYSIVITLCGCGRTTLIFFGGCGPTGGGGVGGIGGVEISQAGCNAISCLSIP